MPPPGGNEAALIPMDGGTRGADERALEAK